MPLDLLVMSAHSADYVWRSAGVIAKYVSLGRSVQIIVLAYGERGESDELWKQGKKLEEIKEIRKNESTSAAKILGAQVTFLDWDDYPIIVNSERQLELVRIIRRYDPKVILTHSPNDPFNIDHETTSKEVHEASVFSISRGVLPEIPVAHQTKIFGFEPNQPEVSDFYPEVMIDVTEVYEKKKRAMDCFETQKHLIEQYDLRSIGRAAHYRRVSGTSQCKRAEAFTRLYPQVTEEFN